MNMGQRKAALAMYEQTHSPGCGGATELCAVCRQKQEFITISHAQSHGFKDRNDMLRAGKIIHWATGKPLKYTKSKMTRLERWTR